MKCPKCGYDSVGKMGRPKGVLQSPETKKKISEGVAKAWERIEKKRNLLQPSQVTNSVELK